ncbi:arsenate reductase ArsC [Maricaulis parjimensis]|uniref:arsenate reductase ArsC n=1 Tax=Maricaulis parjimensis TaxID=144023 RepID=UPI00193A3661|nr:arsenate reductase ArsC [Maricaulis parjimensis]
MLNILILCTGNSARSILGEVLVTALGEGRLQGFSAGSQPKGQPHPVALETLKAHGHPIDRLRSKSWDEFTVENAPRIDAVITVCDSAAAEVCPVWPGAPVKAHWGLQDPAYIEDDAECRVAFEATYQALSKRIRTLLAGLDGDDQAALKRAFQTI